MLYIVSYDIYQHPPLKAIGGYSESYLILWFLKKTWKLLTGYAWKTFNQGRYHEHKYM